MWLMIFKILRILLCVVCRVLFAVHPQMHPQMLVELQNAIHLTRSVDPRVAPVAM